MAIAHERVIASPGLGTPSIIYGEGAPVAEIRTAGTEYVDQLTGFHYLTNGAGTWWKIASSASTIADHPATACTGTTVADHPATACTGTTVADHPATACTGTTVADHPATACTGTALGGNVDLAGPFTAAMRYPFSVSKGWGIDIDGARTNGGGLVGQRPVLTNVAPAYAVVCDDNGGAPQYAQLSRANTDLGAIYAANFQVLPDVPAIGDFAAFGFNKRFCELAIDMNTVATYAGDSCIWEYSKGAGVWGALTITGAAGPGKDNTDNTAYNGARPFQRDGALVFVPPADWAVDTLSGQIAFWIRSRCTALQTTVIGITNGVEHDIVTGEEGWAPPAAGSLAAVVIEDAAPTLHAAAPIQFLLYDETSGEHRLFSFTQGRQRQRITCAAWALDTPARLHCFVVAEDGTNEPANVLLEIEMGANIAPHQHAVTGVVVTQPTTAILAHTVGQPSTAILAHTVGQPSTAILAHTVGQPSTAILAHTLTP